MRGFIKDVSSAAPIAKREAQRELWITIIVSLSTFFVGPLIFAIMILPFPSGAAAFFRSFTGADIYIAAVSLLSISIFSISKEYDTDGRDRFGFPHATTILIAAVVIILVAFTVYTARIFYEALPETFKWRSTAAGVLGWAVFIVASTVAYGVLVLRNDMESGSSRRTRQDEEAFVEQFTAAQHGEQP